MDSDLGEVEVSELRCEQSILNCSFWHPLHCCRVQFQAVLFFFFLLETVEHVGSSLLLHVNSTFCLFV